MSLLPLMLSTLLALSSTGTPTQECGTDCIQALTAALEWVIEEARPKAATESGPQPIVLDIEEGSYKRPESAIDLEKEIAALRHIADSLKIDVVKSSEDRGMQACVKGQTTPECRKHWGRGLVRVMGLRFDSDDRAKVNVNIEILGDLWLGGSGGQRYLSMFAELVVEKIEKRWKVTARGFTVVT